jgi:RNA polymerase sigma-70 factor, ECF subfamily
VSPGGVPGAGRLAPYSLHSDGEIVDAVLQGDTDLFGALIQRHQDALHRMAWSMVQDTDVASDVVQDTFIRAYANLARCREPNRLRVWLMAMLRNRCLDYLKEPRRRHIPLDSAPDVRDTTQAEPLASLAARTELQRALDTLPPTLREAFLLRHVEEMSYEDMAEVLDTTVPGVKMRVSRAREALRQELTPAERPAMEPHANDVTR